MKLTIDFKKILEYWPLWTFAGICLSATVSAAWI